MKEKQNEIIADIVKLLNEIAEDKVGKEHDHIEADGLLLLALKELGYPEVAEAFNKIDKWYA